MKKALFFPLQVSLYTIGYLFSSGSITHAQVVPDGTTNTTVNSDSNGNFTIEHGDRAGNNLFHSFDDFSFPTNGSAFFNNGVPDDNTSTTQFSGFTSLTLGSNPGEDINISAQGSLEINGVENNSNFFNP